MVAVLVILDGASEPLPADAAQTSLELARMPALDRLACEGIVAPLATVPAGLPAGSESAIPVLLGWTPPAPVDRGLLEAAARSVALAPSEHAWRVDVLDVAGERASDDTTAHAAARLAAAVPRHRVRRLAGHRLLVVGPPPFPAGGVACVAPARGPLAADDAPAPPRAERLHVWPEGVVPPRVLDARTVVIGAAGAATGAARLLGARVVVPAGATGDVDTDLRAKATAALGAIAEGAPRVVVHVGAPDEAAHRGDRAAKVAALERIDRELIAPLAAAVRAAGGTLRACPDHGCDPRTGLHDDAPVPCLDWRPEDAVSSDGVRMTERAVAGMPTVALTAREAVAA